MVLGTIYTRRGSHPFFSPRAPCPVSTLCFVFFFFFRSLPLSPYGALAPGTPASNGSFKGGFWSSFPPPGCPPLPTCPPFSSAKVFSPCGPPEVPFSPVFPAFSPFPLSVARLGQTRPWSGSVVLALPLVIPHIPLQAI